MLGRRLNGGAHDDSFGKTECFCEALRVLGRKFGKDSPLQESRRFLPIFAGDHVGDCPGPGERHALPHNLCKGRGEAFHVFPAHAGERERRISPGAGDRFVVIQCDCFISRYFHALRGVSHHFDVITPAPIEHLDEIAVVFDKREGDSAQAEQMPDKTSGDLARAKNKGFHGFRIR